MSTEFINDDSSPYRCIFIAHRDVTQLRNKEIDAKFGTVAPNPHCKY